MPKITRVYKDPDPLCQICGGLGYYKDYVEYGDTWAPIESACECSFDDLEVPPEVDEDQENLSNLG